MIWVTVALVWLALSAGFLAGVMWHAHRADAAPPPLDPERWVSRMRPGIASNRLRSQLRN